MGDYLWLGAAGILVVASLVVTEVLDQRHRKRVLERLKQGPPLQLVREPQPLEAPEVLGRIGPRGVS